MNATWKPSATMLNKKKRNRRLLLALTLLGLSVAALFTFTGQPATTQQLFTSPDSQIRSADSADQTSLTALTADGETTPAAEQVDTGERVHIISSGDTLSSIFDSYELGQRTMLQMIAADESLLALDTLRPGNRLTFTCDPASGKLEQMELYIDAAHQVIFRRIDDESFESHEVTLPGEWHQQILEGEINGSFYLSALAAGLSENETGNITNLLRGKLNFSRDIRAGDHFQVVRSLQTVNDEKTGNSQIEGIRIFSRKNCYAAFLFSDGNYYDENGESLARAFLRYPFKGRYRISSPYNLRRKHPITKRISPHRGVDFAMPSGTPILASADGEVTRTINHRYAGKYIEIRHDGQYLSRYLHLSRILVKKGQKVKRGQQIAKSGNTGRSTGPHLHYELHVKKRAVNPITAAIPMATEVPREKLAAFKQRRDELVSMMEQAETNLVGG